MIDFLKSNAKELIILIFFAGTIVATIRSEIKNSGKRLADLEEIVNLIRLEHSVRKTDCLNEFGEKINSIHNKIATISQNVEYMRGKFDTMEKFGKFNEH